MLAATMFCSLRRRRLLRLPRQ
ncbi:hypothetical protein [Delftia sp. WSY_22]